jgi:hypothetical protein
MFDLIIQIEPGEGVGVGWILGRLLVEEGERGDGV